MKSKLDFLKLMRFPLEWYEWGMFPDQLASIQMSEYEPGQESGSEHNRNAAFHWWLSSSDLTAELLIKLVRLSYLDPDQPMGVYIRECIKKSDSYDDSVKRAIEHPKEFE